MKILAKRKLVLDRAAQAVLRDRQREHGAPENTFEVHAQLFSVYLSQKTGHAINLAPEDVARLMILFKVGRSMANSANGDNWIDIAGYAACGSEIAAAMVDGDDAQTTILPGGGLVGSPDGTTPRIGGVVPASCEEKAAACGVGYIPAQQVGIVREKVMQQLDPRMRDPAVCVAPG